MILELDMTPPTMFQLEFPKAGTEAETSRVFHLDNAIYRERSTAPRVRKSRSWSVCFVCVCVLVCVYVCV